MTWFSIPCTAGLYEASDTGQIRSVPRFIVRPNRWGSTSRVALPGKVLKPWLGSSGYEAVYVNVDGEMRAKQVHRLVAEAFYGERPEMDVNHKDGNKKNNSASNLEWATRSENNHHAVRIGLVKARPVIGVPKDGGESINFPSAGAAALAFGGIKKRGNIVSAALGMIPSAYGFKWSFAPAA